MLFVSSHSSNRPEFILVQRNHIDCREEQPRYLGVALCFDFVYYWCQPFFLLAPRTLVRFPFSLDSPSALTPYGQAVRSLQRAVFTNFISFL